MYNPARAKKKASGSQELYTLPLSPNYRYNILRDATAANIAEEGYKRNDLVFSLITIRASAVKQAKISVEDVTRPGDPVENSPLLDLLQHPNPIMDYKKFMMFEEVYGCIGGDRYGHCMRDAYSQIGQIFPYHASQIQPIQGETSWISHYRYANSSGYYIDLPLEDVIQFQWDSVDFNRPYRSIPPFVAGAKGIDVDNDRWLMDIALLQNGAYPSIVVTLAEGMEANQSELDRISERFAERFGTKNRGKGMFIPFGTQAEPYGFSPKDMVSTAFAELPETRSAQIMGVPLQMTSFKSAGSARTFSNYFEARKAFYEDTMISAWMGYAETMTHFFAKEMFYGDSRKYKVFFDHSEIPALKDSQDSVHDQTIQKFEGNTMKLDEAREQFGLESDPNYGDKYFFELTAPAPIESAPDEKDLAEKSDEEGARLAEYVGKTGRGKVHANGHKKNFAVNGFKD